MKMNLNKETRVSILVAALITATGSAVMASDFAGMIQYVWIFFASFTITTATVHGVKNIPNLVCSHAAGWVWAMFMYYVCIFIMQSTGSMPLGFFICIFIGSVVMLAIHLGMTMGTWFNNISVMYATIFCWFATQDFSKILYVIIAFLTGSILSTVADEIQNAILKK